MIRRGSNRPPCPFWMVAAVVVPTTSFDHHASVVEVVKVVDPVSMATMTASVAWAFAVFVARVVEQGMQRTRRNWRRTKCRHCEQSSKQTLAPSSV